MPTYLVPIIDHHVVMDYVEIELPTLDTLPKPFMIQGGQYEIEIAEN